METRTCSNDDLLVHTSVPWQQDSRKIRHFPLSTNEWQVMLVDLNEPLFLSIET